MTLPTPEEERKVVAMFCVCIALSVIGVMTVMVGGALALVGIMRLIAAWVFG